MSSDHRADPDPTRDEELLSKAIPIEALQQDQEDELDSQTELEPVDPDENPSRASAAGSRIRSFSVHQADSHEDRWQRKPNPTGQGAIHVRTFYAKLREDGVAHLDEQINQWLDQHEEYEVKFVTSAVGQMMGKTSEPALFVNVWV